MSPEFASAVDPVFVYVLDVLAQIESGQAPDPLEVNMRIRGLLDRAENQLGQPQQWDLAKYALSGWIDDVLIEAPWEGCRWWEENRLEFQLFKTAEAFTQFYLSAKEAAELPQKDALEVYYVCVVLGFRGLYGDPGATAHADEFGLPGSLDDWARRTAMTIRLGQGRPPLIEQGRPGMGAPPLEGKYLLIGSGIFGILLAAVVAGGYFLFFSGAA